MTGGDIRATSMRPVGLPHFAAHDGEIRSLSGRLYSSDPVEARLFAKCDGRLSVSELADAVTLASLKEKNLIALVSDPPDEEPSRTVVVVSPHVDDGALSVGGLMRRRANKYVVLNVFSKQKYQTGVRVPEERLEEVAEREDALAGCVLGFRSVNAGLYGAQERHGLAAKDVVQRRYSEVARQECFRRDAEAVRGVILAQAEAQRAALVLAPLGLGGHLDHLVTAQAVYALVKDGTLAESRVAFYEDLPYAAAFEWSASPSEPPAVYGLGVQRTVDITGAIDAKVAALGVYRTRVRKPQIDACVEYARDRSEPSGRFREALWQFGETDIDF